MLNIKFGYRLCLKCLRLRWILRFREQQKIEETSMHKEDENIRDFKIYLSIISRM